jgi:Ran GTPase-activating protein (RanGAP) involved in mRNA processing and transport
MAEGAKAIGDLLSKNTALKVIDLGSNSFGPEGCKHIASGLQHNKTLEKLIISTFVLYLKDSIRLD